MPGQNISLTLFFNHWFFKLESVYSYHLGCVLLSINTTISFRFA